MAKIPEGLPSSSVETAVMKRLEYESSPLYKAICKTLKVDKYKKYYNCRYRDNISWQSSTYSRGSYYRRRKELLNNIKNNLKF